MFSNRFFLLSPLPLRTPFALALFVFFFQFWAVLRRLAPIRLDPVVAYRNPSLNPFTSPFFNLLFLTPFSVSVRSLWYFGFRMVPKLDDTDTPSIDSPRSLIPLAEPTLLFSLRLGRRSSLPASCFVPPQRSNLAFCFNSRNWAFSFYPSLDFLMRCIDPLVGLSEVCRAG